VGGEGKEAGSAGEKKSRGKRRKRLSIFNDLVDFHAHQKVMSPMRKLAAATDAQMKNRAVKVEKGLLGERETSRVIFIRTIKGRINFGDQKRKSVSREKSHLEKRKSAFEEGKKKDLSCTRQGVLLLHSKEAIAES